MKLNKFKKSKFSNAVLTGKHHFCFSTIVIITGIQLLAPLENNHGFVLSLQGKVSMCYLCTVADFYVARISLSCR